MAFIGSGQIGAGSFSQTTIGWSVRLATQFSKPVSDARATPTTGQIWPRGSGAKG